MSFLRKVYLLALGHAGSSLLYTACSSYGKWGSSPAVDGLLPAVVSVVAEQGL